MRVRAVWLSLLALRLVAVLGLARLDAGSGGLVVALGLARLDEAEGAPRGHADGAVAPLAGSQSRSTNPGLSALPLVEEGAVEQNAVSSHSVAPGLACCFAPSRRASWRPARYGSDERTAAVPGRGMQRWLRLDRLPHHAGAFYRTAQPPRRLAAWQSGIALGVSGPIPGCNFGVRDPNLVALFWDRSSRLERTW